MINLHSRISKAEKKLPKEKIKIVVTKSEGGCPTPEEKARINAASGIKHIWVCDCPNCNPERFKGKLSEVQDGSQFAGEIDEKV